MCVRVYKTLNDQKLIESTPRRHLLQDVETSENYLCKNLVGKEGGGCLLKEGILSRAYGKYNEFACRVEEQG